jgi:transcriptional accessory protein Tex/SPT6
MSDQLTAVVEQSVGQVAPPELPVEPIPTPIEPADSVDETVHVAATDDPPTIHTLQIGQHLTGKVKNIAEFGAFVDIGIAQDGLVHISELSKQKVEKVTDLVTPGQEVDVWVKKIDGKRGRISLTMIRPVALKFKDIEDEAELEGVVTRLEPYGAFINIGADRDGLVHISQITYDYIKHPEEALKVGDTVKVKVLKVNRKKRQIDLSIKALLPPPLPPAPAVEAVKKVEESKKPETILATEMADEAEPALTAMATAFAALQGQLPGGKSGKNIGKGNKSRKEMDAIVARTLAGRN